MKEYLKSRRDTNTSLKDFVELSHSNVHEFEKELADTSLTQPIVKNCNNLEVSNSKEICVDDGTQSRNKLSITNLKQNDQTHEQISLSIAAKHNDVNQQKDGQSFVFPKQKELNKKDNMNSKKTASSSFKNRHSIIKENLVSECQEGKESGNNKFNAKNNQQDMLTDEELLNCEVNKRDNVQEEEKKNHKEEDSSMFPIRRRLNAMSETRPRLKRVSFQSLDLGNLNSPHFSKNALNSI